MIQPDRVGGQSCAFRGPVSGIDHAEQQGSGFLIQAVQRMLGQQFLTNPFCTEWWTSPLLTFPEGQFPERQRNPEPLHPVHRFPDITEMDQILVCGIGRNRACLDPFEPVLPEIQHVIACDGCNRLVADDGHEIAHCLDTGISPAPDLVLTLTDDIVVKLLIVGTSSIRPCTRPAEQIGLPPESGQLFEIVAASVLRKQVITSLASHPRPAWQDDV
nr:hypothetical protein [uncultured Hyphomonas sp.]